ncbi:MAG: hypothetical protein ABSH46_08005 [Bryobacteraceae bacterium]|jgi:hypothetical protein
MSAERLLLLAAFAVGASAQDLLTSSSCSGIQALLSDVGGKQTLEGRAELSHAWLNYVFRFQAGYSIDIPLRQFAGEGDMVRVIARVAPSDGSRPPVCFIQSGALLEIPEGDKITGGFFLGEGNYRVDLAVFDQAGRLYQARFNLEAALKGRERKVRLELAPGEVQPIYSLRWKPHSEPVGRGRRLTILFHAASLYGPRTLLLYDQVLLLSSLSTVLSEGAFDEIRLIAFNLDQEQELFRQDRFDVDGFRKLAETLLSLKLSSVPVTALAPGQPRHALIDSLVRAEMSSEKPPDAILFLGPYANDESKWSSVPCESGHAGPAIFYFQHRINRAIGRRLSDEYVGRAERTMGVRPIELPDTLERLVHACSGDVYRIHDPAELASAIAKLNSKAAHVQ